MTTDEMAPRLQRYFAEAGPPGLVRQFLQILRDPFQEGKDGRFRINPQWVLLGTLACLAFAVFIYFNIGSL
jgi:hypothetical protein